MPRFLLSVALFIAVSVAHAADPGIDLFESKIRPVLVEHCYPCHSDAAKKSKGGLKLDTSAGLRAGGDSGPGVVPEKPAESWLVKAIRYGDDGPKMPPKGKLPDAVIADLEKWIALGAADPRITTAAVKPPTPEQGRDWWSFRPLKPSTSAKSIDEFLLVKLHERGLSFRQVADARTLVRRVYLDVTGLPPTPQQVNEYLNDTSPDAYAKLIDRVLTSPHYGERWARHWLDVARFAESSGYEHDNDRPHAWQYRDFVVAAINRDVRYDNFIRWQVAGDELAPDEPLAVKATGFLAAGLANGQVTEREAVKERYETLDDWVGSTGTAFLGLTIGCARCHDHKFDPIPTKDYYNIAANFASAVRVNLNVPRDPKAAKAQTAAHAAKLAELIKKRDDHEAEVGPQQGEAWIGTKPEPPSPPWLVLTATEAGCGQSKGGKIVGHELTRQADGSYLFTRLNGEVGGINFIASVKMEQIKYVRLEALTDETLPNYGPGFGNHGDFRLNSLSLTVTDSKAKPKTVKLSRFKDTTGDKPGSPSWGLGAREAGQDQSVVFELAEPVGSANGTELRFTLSCPGDSPSCRQTIGKFRLSIGTATTRPEPNGVRMPYERYLQGVKDLQEAQSSAEAVALYCLTDSDWLTLDTAVRQEESWKRPAHDVSFGVSEGLAPYRMMIQGPDLYEKSHLLKRGDPDRPESEATPGFLQVLKRDTTNFPATPTGRTTGRRAALALWMTDVDHGAGALAARVAVNRLWQHHFGRGIVATPSDFGAQGDRPTHPELLEWLAAELIRQNWSPKAIHRQILMSQAYRQGGARDTAAEKVDPENKLLWRFAPRRLEAEAIRDSMLAVAGTLDPKLGGPGSSDEIMPRRSLYFTVKRSKLVPSLVQLDWPEALTSIGRRTSTAVPPQALWAMNNPVVRKCAEAFAKRLADKKPNEAIDAAYELALSRRPTDTERATALRFIDSPEALVNFCQALFMLNEFVAVR